jgi:hypothetical protein
MQATREIDDLHSQRPSNYILNVATIIKCPRKQEIDLVFDQNLADCKLSAN